MTVREALSDGASSLSRAGSETPFLDASLLLASASGVDRDRLLSRGEDPVPESSAEAYRGFLLRRAGGESVAYILGKKEFYGRVFRVDRRVLVPRPDTEVLVEAALAEAARISEERGMGSPGKGRYSGIRVHDAFTGSGCVGITLAAELPGAEVSLSDACPDALAAAAENSEVLLGRRLPLFRSDILAGVPGPFDLVTANPPYVSSRETDRIQAAGAGRGAREPRSALDGGPDGLSFYRAFVPEAEKKLAQGGALAVEIGEEQGSRVAGIFAVRGFRDVRILPDLAGRDRVVRGVRA